MMTICFAIDRNGIAAVTARAASGVAFQAVTTVSGRAAIRSDGGINNGRPLLRRADSSTSDGAIWLSPGRPMIRRSAARAYSNSQLDSYPISLSHLAEGADGPGGVSASANPSR